MIAPWREWDLDSRSRLVQYAESKGIPVPDAKRGEPPFSMDANLLHIRYAAAVIVGYWGALYGWQCRAQREALYGVLVVLL